MIFKIIFRSEEMIHDGMECNHILDINGNLIIYHSAITMANFIDGIMLDILFLYCPHCGYRNISEQTEKEVLKTIPAG